MSADAEMVPVAWHIGPIFKLGSEKPGRFGADDSRWQPLYSADTIAALERENEAAISALRAVEQVCRTQIAGSTAMKLNRVREVMNIARAAIDAAQPSEKK